MKSNRIRRQAHRTLRNLMHAAIASQLPVQASDAEEAGVPGAQRAMVVQALRTLQLRSHDGERVEALRDGEELVRGWAEEWGEVVSEVGSDDPRALAAKVARW